MNGSAVRQAIPRDNFVICSTHTHNAPALPGFAPGIWERRYQQSDWDAVERYAAALEDKLVRLAEQVLTKQEEGTLAWGQGRVMFGGNRRLLSNGTWQNFGFQFDGPVDHSLPLLVARNSNGQIMAVWTNYACHCTTVGSRNTVGGDWAGFANDELEAQLDGAVSLTTIGCGADVGPQPTGTLELARQHGSEVAREVARLITAQSLHPLTQQIAATSTTIKLPYADVHDEAYWQTRASKSDFDGMYGRHILRQLQRDGRLDPSLKYSITTWQFGDELGILFLPGEVCVDYAVRIKTENDWQRLWINGWSNDVPCYIPSRRVLHEGGYEPDSSMIYYCRPSRFSEAVEDRIVSAVNTLLDHRFKSPAGQEKPDIFVHPGPEKVLSKSVQQNIAGMDPEQKAIVRRIQALAPAASNGFSQAVRCDLDESAWYDYLGRMSPLRPIVRQTKAGLQVAWQTPAVVGADRSQTEGAQDVVMCFAGALGWSSQPQTDGFQLNVGQRLTIPFDITRRASCWPSKSGDAELLYLPTWTSGEDSAGFFLLVIHDPSIAGNEATPLTISVQSLSNDSQRWFAVDKSDDAADRLRKLLHDMPDGG